MDDFLFRDDLGTLDPAIERLIELEAERQARKLIMIPSESSTPRAVRQALGSVFTNIYAEGYPLPETRWMAEEQLLDYEAQLVAHRRYGDLRYYMGVEYADIAEALARRRCADAFATDNIPADRIYVNVQPLSGAPANIAVYEALLKPGDTILGMELTHGGHLSHGSPANVSGQRYHAVHYRVDPRTELLDYEQIEELALEHRPKIIVAGYTSYPRLPNWAKFRRIADRVGAYLLADIAHVAGMVIAGAYPTPLGHAHVITFTTHKTLAGPRGACILTTDPLIARRVDHAVFPGLQGGPHVNKFVAMAVAFRLARTESFHALQHQIVANAKALAQALQEEGMRIPHGGTDTHLLLVDCKTVVGPFGEPLLGDTAARILDQVGIVCNRNTIPGDPSPALASGIRLGTPWVTQRGLREPEMVELAHLIAGTLKAIRPTTYPGRHGLVHRGRVDFDTLEEARLAVAELADKAGIDWEVRCSGYPHHCLITDIRPLEREWGLIELEGNSVAPFLDLALVEPVDGLEPGPVLIDLPVDISQAEYEPDDPVEMRLPGYRPVVEGNVRQIRLAAECINASERPVIYAGGGTIISGCHRELAELAHKGQIPVTTTLLGLGAFDERSELSLKMLGMHGTAYANYAVTESDCLIAIGSRFDDRVTGRIDAFAPRAKIIHIDIDPASISKNVKVDIPVVGDARRILQVLNQHIEPRDRSEWLARIAEWKRKHPLSYRREAGRIKPQYVVEQICEATGGEAIITTEVGQNQMWAALFYTYTRPRTFISSGGLGTMGYGFPAAIGAQVGRPDAVVFDIAGDGSIQMNIQELATAVQHKLPVNIAILDNGFLGMVRQWQELFFGRRYSHTRLLNPDFVKLAEAYGAVGIRVERPEEVRPAIERAIETPNVVLLDFIVEPEENVFPMVPAGEAIDQMIGGMA